MNSFSKLKINNNLVNFEEKIESNFDDIYNFILESTGINLFEPEVFEEKSHGSLKYEYRIGVDIKTGNLTAIQFKLDPSKIISVGNNDAYDGAHILNDIIPNLKKNESLGKIYDKIDELKSKGRDKEAKEVEKKLDEYFNKMTSDTKNNALDYMKKHIKKVGHIDYVSDESIVDKIFHKNGGSIQSVEIIPTLSNQLYGFLRYLESNYDIDQFLVKSPYSYGRGPDNYSYSYERLFGNKSVRSEFIKYCKDNKITGEKYEVGKLAGKNKYKSTKILWDSMWLYKKFTKSPVLRGKLNPWSIDINDYTYNGLNKPKTHKFNESYEDDLLDDEVFTERSHGKLKHSFRMGINVDNGHLLKIVFDLNKEDVAFVGSHDNTNPVSDEDQERIINSINKTGYTDFVSKGKVLAIIDMDTKERLKSVTASGVMSGLQTFASKTLEEREKLAKDETSKIYGGIKYVVGQIEGADEDGNMSRFQRRSSGTYKSTKPAEKLDDLSKFQKDPLKYGRGYHKESYDMNSLPDVMYYSSRNKHEQLIGRNGKLFLSPYIGISSIFMIDTMDAMAKHIQSKTGKLPKTMSFNTSYDEWNYDNKYLNQPLEIVHITHNIPSITDIFTGESSGFIHVVDVSNIKDKLSLFVTNDPDREVIYTGDQPLTPIKIIHHTLKWEMRFDQNNVNAHGVGSILMEGASNNIIIRPVNSNNDINKTIQESLDWIDQFVHDEEFRENAYNIMIYLNNPNELLRWMINNIKYGWKSAHGIIVYDINSNNEFINNYRLQAPSKLIESGVGICFDQCELERRWFTKHSIEHGIFYIELQGQEIRHFHTFLVYHMYDSYYWFEHASYDNQGIHKYDNLRSLLIDVALKQQKDHNDNTSPIYLSLLKDPPKYGISIEDYISYAHSQYQLDINNLPVSFNESYCNLYNTVIDYMKEDENNNVSVNTKQEFEPVFGIVMKYTNSDIRNDGVLKDKHELDYTKFNKMIKFWTGGDNYGHAGMSFDDTLNEIYSYSDEGFVTESINDNVYRTTDSIYICVMFVTPEDKKRMKDFIKYLSDNKDETAYAYHNLLDLAIFKPSKIDKRFVCSSFVGYILNISNPKNLHRDYSRVRPEDITILPRAFYVMNVRDQQEFHHKYNEIHGKVQAIYNEYYNEINDYNNHLPKLMLQDTCTKYRTLDKILDKIISIL